MKQFAVVGNSTAGNLCIIVSATAMCTYGQWCACSADHGSGRHRLAPSVTAGQLAKRQKVVRDLKAALQEERKKHAEKQASLQSAEHQADAAARCALAPRHQHCMHDMAHACMVRIRNMVSILMDARILRPDPACRQAQQLREEKHVLEDRVAALWKERASLMQQIKVGRP